MGITLPKATLLGWELSGDISFFFVIFIYLIVMTWIAVNMIRTKYGRAFIAIRDNDRAAEGMGSPFSATSFYRLPSVPSTPDLPAPSGHTTW